MCTVRIHTINSKQMPAWCNNIITICGSQIDIDDFMIKMKTPGILKFNDFIPVPETVNESASARMDWCCSNWGAYWNEKLDIGEQMMTKNADGTFVRFAFLTEFTPPQPFVISISGQFPFLEMHLSYFEPESAFAGYVGYIDECEQEEMYCEWQTNDEYKKYYKDANKLYRIAWEVPEDYDSEDGVESSYESDLESTSIEDND